MPQKIVAESAFGCVGIVLLVVLSHIRGKIPVLRLARLRLSPLHYGPIRLSKWLMLRALPPAAFFRVFLLTILVYMLISPE